MVGLILSRTSDPNRRTFLVETLFIYSADRNGWGATIVDSLSTMHVMGLQVQACPSLKGPVGFLT
jgi:hypothetical protein